jgi:carboxyl-terminal processing protease
MRHRENYLNFIGRPLRWVRHAGQTFAAFALLIVLTACTAPVKPNITAEAQPKSEVARMYTKVLGHIHKMYLDELPVDRLAIAGLSGLKKLEADSRIRRENGRISLLINDTPVGHVTEPTRNDAENWAEAIDELIEAGRQGSTKLAAIDIETVYKVTIDSLLSDLDRYTRYAGRTEGRRNRESREGFGGIGVAILRHDDGVRIERVTPDLPASRAGIKPGDVFIAVDGTPLQGQSLRRSVRLLRGPLGKPVQVTVRRENRPDSFVLTISRTRIIPATVQYKIKGKIAYLRMTGFNQDTTKELRAGVHKATRELGPALEGLVLDLRGNPGGLLDQAVSAADLFLHDGRISTTHGRHPDSLQLFDASDAEIAQDLPIVVLVNGASASASEVLAAALQDRGRAVVVGSSSFGKGTVQTVIRLPNDGELILTWARLLTPSGYVLNKVGVIPTLCTSNAKNVIAVIKRAFTGSAPHHQIATTDIESRKALVSRCPWQPHEGEDLDITVAKRILEKPELYQNALRLSAPAAGG